LPLTGIAGDCRRYPNRNTSADKISNPAAAGGGSGSLRRVKSERREAVCAALLTHPGRSPRPRRRSGRLARSAWAGWCGTRLGNGVTLTWASSYAYVRGLLAHLGIVEQERRPTCSPKKDLRPERFSDHTEG
jgi:hypothetical protein